jgi:tetratricopeptide (TPR) repeat protein
VASIVAWGGVGKTALVNGWRNKLRDAGWSGAERVFDWSFYRQGTGDAGSTSADEFVSAALRWFGDPDPTAGSPWDKGARLAERVSERRTLLLLDGMEPLQSGPGQGDGSIKDPALQALVRGLSLENAGLCVITTRISVADLASLAGDKVREKKLTRLSAEAGALLLEERGTRGTPEELRAAAEEYKGHCLALTLLGSYLRKACKGDIRRRDEIPSLENERQHGAHARRIMAAYERWFEGQSEIAVLRMLGLFDRPASESEVDALRAPPTIKGLTDALEGLSPSAWNEALTTLRDMGLLVEAPLGGSSEELDAHPLVREHFGAQVRQLHPAAWREGHRRLYEHLAETAKPLPETLEEMTRLYVAVTHGCRAGLLEHALDEVYRARIQRGKEYFSSRKLGAFGAEAATLASFYEAPWETLREGLDEADQSWLLTETAFSLRALGRFDESTRLLRRALVTSRAQQGWRTASINAGCLAEIALTRGKIEGAIALSEEAIEAADKSENGYQQMLNHAHRAGALHAAGRLADADAAFVEAESAQARHEPQFPLLYSVQGFRHCDFLLEQRRYAAALDRARQTFAWALRVKPSLLSIAMGHLALGSAHLALGLREPGCDFAVAAEHLTASVAGFRSAGHQEYLPLGLLARAELHIHRRDFSGARRDVAEALALGTRCGFRLHEADAHLGYARLSIAEGETSAGREQLALARAIIEETGYHRREEELERLEVMSASKVEIAIAPAPTPASSRVEVASTAFEFSFPPPLIDAYRRSKLAILFGSGLSIARDVAGDFPRWDALPSRLLDQAMKHGIWSQAQIEARRAIFAGGSMSLGQMLTDLDGIKAALRGPRKYQAALNDIFRPRNAAPGDVHRALVAVGAEVLATTNYDELLEHVEGPPARAGYTWRDADQALSDIQEGRKVLFKIHGSAEDEGTVVMTRAEYTEAAAHVPYQRAMSFLLQSYTFLLVGYGVNDPFDLDLVFSLNSSAFGGAARAHYALVKDAAPGDRDRWQRDLNVQVVPYQDYGDLPAILRALRAAKL